MRNRIVGLVNASLIAVGLIVASTMAAADDAPGVRDAPWGFNFKVYGWLPEAPATIKVDQTEVANLPEDLDTIIDGLEMAFMGEFELRKGPLGLFVSPVYYEGDVDENFTGLLGEPRKLDVSEEVWLVDYGVGWDFGPWNLSENAEYPTLTLTPFVGARYFHDSIEMDVEPGLLDQGLRVRTTVDFNTPFVGLKAFTQFSERWSLGIEGDYGVADASEVNETYQVSGVFAYHFKIKERHAQWFAGYRYLKLDLESDPLEVKVDVKGPLFGFGMEF